MKINNRLNLLGDSTNSALSYAINKRVKDNKEIFDFGIGDPNIKIREEIVEGLLLGLKKKNFNNYPPYEGIYLLKEKIINYYKEIYNVFLSEDEVLITSGAKDAIVDIIPSICNFKDSIIITEPAYPVYNTVASLWGVEVNKVPICSKNNYLPDLNISCKILNESKIFIINYPNNPSGAIANEKFYKDIIDLSIKHSFILVNDGAYNEIVWSGKPLSLLSFDKELKSIEIGSFSKIFNMTGFRLGYVVGNKEVIKGMLRVKRVLDSGQFIPIQYAGINALSLLEEYRKSICKEYYNRKEKLIKILKEKRISYFNGGGGIYLWCNIPSGWTTEEFCIELLEKYGIIVIPGYNFGSTCHGYFRIALTNEEEVIEEVFSKLPVYSF